MVAESAGRRFFRASPATWAVVVGGLLAVSTVAMLPLTLLAHQVFGGLVALVVGVPCAGVGVIVARRQPRNPIGWLFLVIAACVILATDGMDYPLLDAGAGYVFTLRGGAWSQTGELTASGTASGNQFGTSVALSAGGSTALVGAIGYNSYAGAGYVFTPGSGA